MQEVCQQLVRSHLLAYFAHGIDLWNTLPVSVRCVETFAAFRRECHRFLNISYILLFSVHNVIYFVYANKYKWNLRVYPHRTKSLYNEIKIYKL